MLMRMRPLGIGLVAPGLMDWPTAAAVLRNERPYEAEALSLTAHPSLTPTERRRATLGTRLAMEAARQATSEGNVQTAELPSVFASSDGDMGLIDSLCRSIFEHREPPSPTVFQNSVHNAVAGYWSIAEGCREASTSIAVGDGTFAAGLLEAATQVTCRNTPVLLVAFDVPAPELLHPHRTFACAFACALLLGPAPDSDERALTVALTEQTGLDNETTMRNPELESLRMGNPAARALPLLAAFAGASPRSVRLPYWTDLQVEASLR
jgi:hypothetical protein